MKRYDETSWCQLLWPWFGPPWYAQIKDPPEAGASTPYPCAWRRR